MRYIWGMKTATIPSVRVTPVFRAEIESLLGDTESLSEFVESSVADAVRRRRNQAAFVVRGLASLAEAKQTNQYVDADVVIAHLAQKIQAAKALQSQRLVQS